MAKAREKQAFYKLSVWLSESEHHLLIQRAGQKRLSDYARYSLCHTKGKTHLLSPEDAAHMLALLGKTRQHSNINQIAHAIHCGTVSFSDKTEAAILEATEDIKDIRRRLITLTGKRA